MIIRWQKMRVFIDQGSCRDRAGGVAEGALTPLPLFWLIKSLFCFLL